MCTYTRLCECASSDLIVAATSAGDNTLCCVDHTLPSRLYRFQWLVRVGLGSWSSVTGRTTHSFQLARPLDRPSGCQGFAGLSCARSEINNAHYAARCSQIPKAGAGSAGDGLIMHASPHPAQPRPRFFLSFASFSLPCVVLSHLACVA